MVLYTIQGWNHYASFSLYSWSLLLSWFTSPFFVSQNITQCSTLSGLVKEYTTVLEQNPHWKQNQSFSCNSRSKFEGYLQNIQY